MKNEKTQKNLMNSEIPLPPTAQVVADVIGREATLALAMSCLYRCLYVPKGRLASDSYLVRTIGEEKAKLMQREFCGMLLPLATCHHIAVFERQQRIRAAVAEGKTHAQVAVAYGLTVKWVRNLCARKPDEYRYPTRGVVGSSTGGRERVCGNSRNLARD
jgi:hypothetical protein